MKIQYLAEDIPLSLTSGKIYDVIDLEKGPDLISGKGEADWLRIVDDTEEDYLYQLIEGRHYKVIEN